jgi:fatty acid desaturase
MLAMEHSGQLIAPHRLPRRFFEMSPSYAYVNFLGTMAIICALVFVGGQLGLPWMIPVAVLVGIIQYRMSIVLHDCVHLSLFKGRRANSIVGTVAAATLFTTFGNFQAGHMAHHKYYRTDQDPSLPDYDLHPQSRWEMIWFIVQPLFGISVLLKLKQFWDVWRSPSQKQAKAQISSNQAAGIGWQDIGIFAGVQFVFFMLAGFNILNYLFLVFAPVATVVLFLSRLRTLLEHGDVDHDEHPPMNCGRNTLSSWLEQNILSPLNFNYHYWHHKYPALPSCQLPEFHNWYMQEGELTPEITDETIASSFGETLWHFYSVAAAHEQPASSRE